MIVHPIEPLFDEYSEVLILGSFPSVKSRENGFFYGHIQNRFWKVIAALFDYEVPSSIEEKKKIILDNHLALWDVIHSCDIKGSSDASINNVVENDLSIVLEESKVKKIFCNGTKSYNLYNKYIYPKIEIVATLLPSTSPANAAFSLEKLIEAWKVVKID